MSKAKRPRVSRVAILPALITLGNTICGFASIAFAADDKFEKAAWMVLLAMVFDALDGKVARMTRSMSAFGGQLDSLSDAISFGLAPAILVLQFSRYHEAVCLYPSKFIWLCSVFYATCAILRLARFNVEHVAESESHEVFHGLPSPGAAGFVVSMVLCFMFLLFLRDVPSSTAAVNTPPLAHEVSRTLWFLPKAIAYALPFLAVGCGVLMVSRLSYVHVLNRFLTRRTPLFRLVQLALLLLVVLAIGPEVSAAFVFAAYILSGPISYYFWRRKHLARKLGPGVHPQPTRIDQAEGEHHSE